MYKQKKTHHISEFDSYLKICELKKKKSPISILFCTNDLPDKWLIDVVEYKTSTGVVNDTYIITKGDVKKYLKFCSNNGFSDLTKF